MTSVKSPFPFLEKPISNDLLKVICEGSFSVSHALTQRFVTALKRQNLIRYEQNHFNKLRHAHFTQTSAAVTLAIEEGLSRSDLQKLFSDRVIARAINDFSSSKYDTYKKLLGEAASDFSILLDECVHPDIAEASHTYIGLTSNVHKNGLKGKSDATILQSAESKGIDAIVTRDKRGATKCNKASKDLCARANGLFAEGQNAPHVILIDNRTKTAIEKIKEGAAIIQAYLNNPSPEAILDLRTPKI